MNHVGMLMMDATVSVELSMASLTALMEQTMTLLENFNQIPLQLVSVAALTI